MACKEKNTFYDFYYIQNNVLHTNSYLEVMSQFNSYWNSKNYMLSIIMIINIK